MRPVFEGSPFSWDIVDDTLVIRGDGDLEYPVGEDGRLQIPWYYLDFHFVRFEGEITSIGAETFHTSDLVTVDIPDSVVSIGPLAFCECRSLENVNLGKGLRTIGEYAFMDCDRLGRIDLGEIVTEIGYNAFENCTGLMAFTSSPVLESLGDHAFLNCRCLRAVALPSTVRHIGRNPFADCIVMGMVTIDAGCEAYVTENGVVYTSDRTEIVSYPAFRTGPFRVPDTVRRIRGGAF
ncbi:MAG: leucine-rich repeat domain-containing protein, partial [archaeon]|nr:leucine-rich repeat domain-containing protein [archaeon]